MHILLRWCSQVVANTPLALWPSERIAASEVPKNPGLIQWLALVDSRQCDPMVESCLSQLLKQGSDD